MNASYLSIFCPEHNQYVTQVCLVNNCYQKLLCDICHKKHREVHKNQQMPLVEFINHLKLFQAIKLEEGEDLSELQEQMRTGQRILRGKDGKQSQVGCLMLSCLNGKDQEFKSNVFQEKATKTKNSLTEKEIKDFSNGMQMFLQTQQRRVLQFEKSMMESISNQLKRATSRRVLDEKYLKDGSISQILEDLKDNSNRYNQLSKNIQKLHKGYLELKVSKKIFRDMSNDIQSRLKVFSKNLLQYFDSEFNKQFSFMIDINEEIVKQSVFDNAIGKNDGQQITDSEGLMKIAQPTQKSYQDMKLQYVNDKDNPNIKLTQLVLDLEKINRDTKEEGNIHEIYPIDVAMKQSQIQKGENKLKDMLNNTQQNNDGKLSKYQQLELMKKLDYQKKEYKVNLEKTECIRFTIIKNNCINISNSNNSNNKVSLKQMSYLFTEPSASNNSTNKNSESFFDSQNISSSQQLFATPHKKNFRIHVNSSHQAIRSQTAVESSPNTSEKIIQSARHDPFFSPKIITNSRQVGFANPLEQQEMEQSEQKKYQIKNINIPASSNQMGYLNSATSSQNNNMMMTSLIQQNNVIDISILCDYKNCNLLNAVSNPNIRVMGFLEQLKLTSSGLANPISKTRPVLKQQSQNSYLFKLQKDKTPEQIEQEKFKQQLQQQQSGDTSSRSNVNQNTNNVNNIANNNSNPINNLFAIGIESVSSNKFLVIFQNGNIQAYSINTNSLQPTKIKELQVCKTISCYVEVLKRDRQKQQYNNNDYLNSKLHQQQISAQQMKGQNNSNVNINNEISSNEDVLMLLSGVADIQSQDGQKDQLQQQLFIIKYEGRKNRFFLIDTIRLKIDIQSRGIISSMDATLDKLFQKKNVPTSLQLVTDAYYVYTVNLFDNDEDYEIQSQPSITVSRIQFHKDKIGSSERHIITKIKIKHSVIISRVLFDPINDCLWGHSDYMLFKWRVNNQSKSLETQDSVILCHSIQDVITSMQINEQIVMISSLNGNIYGIDVMFNKAISKDCQRYKYVSINNYNKIQGKDPINIISGSKVIALNKFKNSSSNNNDKQQQQQQQQQLSNENKSDNQQFSMEYYFIYSVLSQAGAKLFCFDSEFKEVAANIPGQDNHICQTIALGDDNFVVGLEDFDSVRIWRNDFF